MTNEIVSFCAFLVFVLGVVSLDLGVFSRRGHVVTLREAGAWSAAWVALALGFSALLRTYGELIHGPANFAELDQLRALYAPHLTFNPADLASSLAIYRHNLSLEFLTGWLLEYALSVDNIFVIILIFSSFGVPAAYHKKVLLWGILGALVMRFAFIFIGAGLVARFHWVLYLFGIFLVFTGARMLFIREAGEVIETDQHPVVRFAARFGRLHPRLVGDRFFVQQGGRWLLTPLFLVLLIVEFTDLLFAVDSVPAVFSVTRDPYVVFFSNVFAIMGLRSMFFLLTNTLHLFRFLKTGLAVLLGLVGGKMLAGDFLAAMGFTTSHWLLLIVGILAASVLASLAFPKVPAAQAQPQPQDHH